MVDCDVLYEWTQLTRIIAENEPRFVRQKQFPGKYRDVANRILVIIDSQLNQEDQFDSPDDYLGVANECDQLAVVVKSMKKLGLIESNAASSLTERLEDRSNEYSERAREIGAEPDYEPDDYRSAGEESIDLNEFFRDL